LFPALGEIPHLGKRCPIWGKTGGGRGIRDYENLLFTIKLFKFDELAQGVLCILARISNTPFERGNEMRKIFTVLMAVAFVFSVAGFAIAAEKAAAPAAAPAAEKAPAAAPAAEKAPAAKKASKPKVHEVAGTIEALDAAAGTFTVKGKKGNVELKAGEKVKLGDFKVGEKVVVKYADGTASSVKAHKAKKAAKKAEPKAEAKPMAPPAAPAEKK
jgi:hypothetical protein